MPNILIIRPQNRQAEDAQICQQHGWTPIPFAPISIQTQPENLARLPEQIAQADAIFWVSPTAVETAQISGSLKTIPNIAVGTATAKALQHIGATQIVHSETGNDSEAALVLPIWDALPHGANILIVRGQNGRETLAETLRQRGFNITYAEIYRREPQPLDWTIFQAAPPKAAWVTSSEMAQTVFAQAPPTYTQTLNSLIYFTHHARIAHTLSACGAQNAQLVRQLADGLSHYSLHSFPLETIND
ncbi:uroporphyrinogen-III synthase [Kingella negevensis]|uniref:uroporphyrinogen-III synthase n=1 Tax=Kingella negevensis TaxID=1522312 RepID=UPI002543BAFF|nr:uroporphyrinogen-III synthase [Kingella negevensis]WII92890.1 uroporphyrinogen-III synthase [Kingella negevensis]